MISPACDERGIGFVSEIINTVLSPVHICVRSLQCYCGDDGAFYLEMVDFMENLSCLFERRFSSAHKKPGSQRKSEQSD